jgi:hypothetical protein
VNAAAEKAVAEMEAAAKKTAAKKALAEKANAELEMEAVAKKTAAKKALAEKANAELEIEIAAREKKATTEAAAVKAVAEMEAAEKAEAEEELASLFAPTVSRRVMDKIKEAMKECDRREDLRTKEKELMSLFMPLSRDEAEAVDTTIVKMEDKIFRVEDCLHIGGGL